MQFLSIGRIIIRLLNRCNYTIFEPNKAVKVLCIQCLLFKKFPQSFNDVQVWRIRRKKQESDAEFFCQRYDKLAMLVPGIIQDNHNWQVIIFCGKLMKKISDHLGINVGGVGQKFNLFGDSVNSTEDIQPLATSGRFDKQAG